MVQSVETLEIHSQPWMNCISHSHVHSPIYYSRNQSPRMWQTEREDVSGGEILHAGSESSHFSSLPIYSDGRHDARQYEVRLTVAGLWGWRSPPRRLPSAQTQTGPGLERRGGNRTRRSGDQWFAVEKAANRRDLCRDGTLVRTKPGLWSRMCSRVAAMSISFTPGNQRRQEIQWGWRNDGRLGARNLIFFLNNFLIELLASNFSTVQLFWQSPSTGHTELITDACQEWFSPFAIRFNTMSMRMYEPVLLVPSLRD